MFENLLVWLGQVGVATPLPEFLAPLKLKTSLKKKKTVVIDIDSDESVETCEIQNIGRASKKLKLTPHIFNYNYDEDSDSDFSVVLDHEEASTVRDVAADYIELGVDLNQNSEKIVKK